MAKVAAKEKIAFAPAVLRWARTSAKMREEDAAKKSGYDIERIKAWESGADHPSVAQARKLAEVYRRPFAVMFAREPPKDAPEVPPDRRTVPDGLEQNPAAIVFAVRRGEEMRLNILDIDEEVHRFPLTAPPKTEAAELARYVRAQLA